MSGMVIFEVHVIGVMATYARKHTSDQMSLPVGTRKGRLWRGV
jgi:hypothetical protein